MKQETTRSDKMLKEIIDLYALDNEGRKSIYLEKKPGSRYALLSDENGMVMMHFRRVEFEQVERLCGEMGVTIELKED